MKNLVLGAAISAVMLSGAANAAISVDAVTGLPIINPADTNIVYLSGASAARKFMEELFTNNGVAPAEAICDSTKPIWKYKDSINGKKQNAYLCELSAANLALSGLAKPNLLIYKRSEGGSAQGVSPIIADAKGLATSAIEFLKINNTACTLGAAPVAGTSLGSITCAYDLADATKFDVVTPDFGVSDVDPGQFRGVNTPAGFDPVSSDDVALLNVQGTAASVFGIPVTTSLRNALQEAEIASGDVPATCVIGDETEACMPTLSKAQIASIYTGKINNWNQLMIGGSPLFSGATTPAASPRVHICRRVQGSGTQAQHGIKFLNSPCSPVATNPAKDTGAPEFFPITQVHELSASGDVTDCLNELEAGVDVAANGFNNIYPGQRWAVGIQALEKNANLADDFRFIKVDGVAPTLANVVNGKYYDWVELTFQYSNTHAWATDVQAIADAVIASAGNPVVLAALNTKFNHSFGQSGLMAVPTIYPVAANATLDLAAPVNPYTHATAAAGVDNCRVPTILGGQLQL
ncbi:MAG: hypothetical protein QM500_15270 [Methylococcales bacterium]